MKQFGARVFTQKTNNIIMIEEENLLEKTTVWIALAWRCYGVENELYQRPQIMYYKNFHHKSIWNSWLQLPLFINNIVHCIFEELLILISKLNIIAMHH